MTPSCVKVHVSPSLDVCDRNMTSALTLSEDSAPGQNVRHLSPWQLCSSKLLVRTAQRHKNCVTPKTNLKGYSGLNLIHVLTHLDTEYDPSRDKVCGPLANVVLASSETTTQQHTAVNGSKYESPSKSHS